MTTLWVGATEGITEADLVDAFYSYGELKAVRLANNCAFVEFADREAAERPRTRNIGIWSSRGTRCRSTGRGRAAARPRSAMRTRWACPACSRGSRRLRCARSSPRPLV